MCPGQSSPLERSLGAESGPDHRIQPNPTFWRSLAIARDGVVHTFRSQRNARIQFVIGLLAIGLGLWLGIDRLEWALLVVLISLVFVLEALNTAVEALVDLVTDRYHPLARIAKDAAAGAVLLAVVGSVVVGLLIFLPRLWRLFLC